ncbi:hypothetical protein N9Z98_02390, partial [Akkermansiaceae bacterium]|nr:hypothetical protein [Akkermansiaceae bacterium]
GCFKGHRPFANREVILIVFTFFDSGEIPTDMARVDSDYEIFKRERAIVRQVGSGFPIKQGPWCGFVLRRENESIVSNNGLILRFVYYDPFLP